MTRKIVSHQANARIVQSVYDKQKPLSEIEAARARLALEKTNIPDVVNRYNAKFIKLGLKVASG